MPYSLKFSDQSKIQEILIPDMPPGVNTIDTSLTLIGKGYPNYGEKISENFLKLLENFASALPPENPIEGQLWYDTSDPDNKVLRIMDGSVNETRWPSANGIYQQGVDPKSTPNSSLKNGDIWVDTSSNQLKIYNSNNWTLVGPFTTSGVLKTGSEPAIIQDTSDVNRSIIINYIDGEVISIISKDTFVPKVVIDGFTTLRPGINLSIKHSETVNGNSLSASSLKIDNLNYSASKFLLKDDNSFSGQTITGKVLFNTPTNQLGAQGRDGLLINISGYNSNEYIQLYKFNNDAVLLNNKENGKIIFKVKSNTSSLTDILTLDKTSIGINTSTSYLSPTLDVYGNARILSTLTIVTSASISLITNGGISSNNIEINENLLVHGVTTTTGVLNLGSSSGSGVIIQPNTNSTYDIGSSSKQFRQLYVSAIGSTGTGTTVYGRVIGPSRGLEYSSSFSIEGQITATSVIFSGNGNPVVLDAKMSSSAISAQQLTTTASFTSSELLILDTQSIELKRISKNNFLNDVYPPGIVMMYGFTDSPNPIAPAGWLFCSGNVYLISDYSSLFSIIGYTYGGSGLYFRVPDLSNLLDNNNNPIRYIIKT
jgi:hypothetical protein